MRASGIAPFVFSCLFCFLAHGGPAEAQETEADLSRILQPLPDYDPFDKPPPTPEFFPDEVDKHAREALIDSLTNNQTALQGQVRFFQSKDAELMRERRTVTGLTNRIVDLWNSTIHDRERFLEAQKKMLASASSPEEKKIVEATLRTDELTQAEELSKRSKMNRWGSALNTLLSSVDLVGIMTGSYAAAAADSVVSELLRSGSREMSVEERKALTLYLEYLKRNPSDPKNAAIWKKVEALDKKKKKELVEKQLEAAAEASAKNEMERAGFHYEAAAFIDPASKEAKTSLERFREQARSLEDKRKEALKVAASSDPGGKTTAESAQAKDLLDALTLRKPDEIASAAAAMEKAHAGRPLADAAKDARAVAYEIAGRHDDATRLLQGIARSSSSPHERKRADRLLSNPEYNSLAAFHKARRSRQLETIKFVLLGEDFLKKNLLMATGPLVAQGVAGASSLGAANVILLGTNLLQVLTSNPISSQAVLDKGLAYVRNHPESQNSDEVYRVLAQGYEEAGMLDKALMYYQMSGATSEKKISELKAKAGKALLAAADRAQDNVTRESYLTSVLESFPESPAAEEATRKLALMSKVENQGLRISKQFLSEQPDLYGPEGLRLKPGLFDRNRSNMELADLGVNILSDTEVLLHFQTPWGNQSRSYSVEKKALDNFMALLRKKNQQVALRDVDVRPKGSSGGFKGVPPAILQRKLPAKEGGAEETDLTLLREAGGPGRFPRVLDYQLMSEHEKDPSRKYNLPPVQGSISGRGFQVSGSLPAGLSGNRLAFGTDERSPYAGLQLPIPMLEGFVPVDFMLQGRPGGLSIFPRIHTSKDQSEDKELYR